MEVFSPPWLEALIIPRDSWWFLRPLAPPNAGNHKESGFHGKMPVFSDPPLFYIKILKICDFPLLGVQGASKTTNIPLGLAMVSTMGAKRPPFCKKKGVDLIKIH